MRRRVRLPSAWVVAFNTNLGLYVGPPPSATALPQEHHTLTAPPCRPDLSERILAHLLSWDPGAADVNLPWPWTLLPPPLPTPGPCRAS